MLISLAMMMAIRMWPVSSHLVVVLPQRNNLVPVRSKREASGKGLTQRLSVTTTIEERYARTLYQNIVDNNQDKEEEVLFQMVLPEDAFISRFAIESGGKLYHAEIQGKEDAEKTYNEAVSRGQTAGHVAVSARDSNEFSVSVNVGRGERLTFHLLYEELVKRRLGKYNHTITAVTTDTLKDIRVKYLIGQSAKKMAHLTFELGDKKLLALGSGGDLEFKDIGDRGVNGLKAEKVVSAGAIVSVEVLEDKIVLEYADSLEEGVTNTWRQFTISYDTDHNENLGIDSVIEGSYFAQFIAPEKLPGLNKFVVFVMDISGSMNGERIEQAKKAQIKMLRSLSKNDVFSLVVFNEVAYVWKKRSFTKTIQSKFGNSTVTFKNSIQKLRDLEKAIKFTENIFSVGGTNINSALLESLTITSKLALEFQPIIMFLTDGEATSGETRSQQILENVASSNSQLKSQAAIFSLGFGAGADFDLLETLSLQNYGVARKIYDGDDATDQINQIFSEFGLPVLSELTFQYYGNEVGSLTQSGAHRYYTGTELVVAGQLVGGKELNTLQYHVRGTGKDQEFTAVGQFRKKTATLQNKIASPFNETQEENLIERLWVYKMIHAALDERTRCGDSKQGDCAHVEDTVEQATQLALSHGFVTPLTSLVVVKPEQEHQIEEEKENEVDYGEGNRPMGTPRRKNTNYKSLSGIPMMRDTNFISGSWNLNVYRGRPPTTTSRYGPYSGAAPPPPRAPARPRPRAPARPRPRAPTPPPPRATATFPPRAPARPRPRAPARPPPRAPARNPPPREPPSEPGAHDSSVLNSFFSFFVPSSVPGGHSSSDCSACLSYVVHSSVPGAPSSSDANVFFSAVCTFFSAACVFLLQGHSRNLLLR